MIVACAATLSALSQAWAPRPVADALRAGIRGSERVMIDGSGHLPNVEAPDGVTAEIRRFSSPGR